MTPEKLHSICVGVLRNQIHRHGAITPEWIGSAAKRMSHQIAATYEQEQTSQNAAASAGISGRNKTRQKRKAKTSVTFWTHWANKVKKIAKRIAWKGGKFKAEAFIWYQEKIKNNHDYS